MVTFDNDVTISFFLLINCLVSKYGKIIDLFDCTKMGIDTITKVILVKRSMYMQRLFTIIFKKTDSHFSVYLI